MAEFNVSMDLDTVDTSGLNLMTKGNSFYNPNFTSSKNVYEAAIVPPVTQPPPVANMHKSPLETVLEQQVQIAKGISDAVSIELTSNPQTLRFEYPLENDDEVRPKSRKSQPTVYRDQDRFVPINNIGRTMRNGIPKSGKVSKDAKECMQECVSEFISFLTSEASDRCIDEKRKTITGDDILFALSNLGFDNYIDPLQNYLKKYREFVRLDKSEKEMKDFAVLGGQETNTLSTDEFLHDHSKQLLTDH